MKENNNHVRRKVALPSLAKYPNKQKSGAWERLVQVLTGPESERRSFLVLWRDSKLFLVCLLGVCYKGLEQKGKWYTMRVILLSERHCI